MAVIKIIGRDIPPSYPTFSEIIIIHTYASKMKIGRLISGKEVPFPFTNTSKHPLNKLYNYSKKNVKYSGNPTEEFLNILLGYRITNTYHISHTITLQQIKCNVGPYCFKKRPQYQLNNRPNTDAVDTFTGFR